MDRAIMAANERQEIVVQNEEARELYEMRRKAEWDWVSGIDGARRECELKGRKEVARNALAKGYSMDMIHDITGLDTGTIARLRQRK